MVFKLKKYFIIFTLATTVFGLFCMNQVRGEEPGEETLDGVLTYSKDMLIGKKSIPNSVNKVVIKKNVKVTGSFFVPADRKTKIAFEGEDRETSVIEGNQNTGFSWEQNSAFCINSNIQCEIKNLTSLNPRGYHVRGKEGGTQTVTKVNFIDKKQHYETNGFGGNAKVNCTNSYFDTYDDVFVIVSHGNYIGDCTIIHNKNGAPFQMGWGTQNIGSAKIRNVTVKQNAAQYNSGVISWNQKTFNEFSSRTLDIQGLKVTKSSGGSDGPVYQMGTYNNKVNNAKVTIENFSGYKDRVKKFNGSTGVFDWK